MLVLPVITVTLAHFLPPGLVRRIPASAQRRRATTAICIHQRLLNHAASRPPSLSSDPGRSGGRNAGLFQPDQSPLKASFAHLPAHGSYGSFVSWSSSTIRTARQFNRTPIPPHADAMMYARRPGLAATRNVTGRGQFILMRRRATHIGRNEVGPFAEAD